MPHRRKEINDLLTFDRLEDEIDVQRIFHENAKASFEGNFLAPVSAKFENGCKVLDIGCGIGSWLSEMATTYPRSHFTGTDVEFIVGTDTFPSNVTFIKRNTLDGLPFEDDTFDFVHQRFVNATYPGPKLEFVATEMYRVCKPGGWVELTEMDLAARNAGPKYVDLMERTNSLFRLMDCDPQQAVRIPSILSSVGFQRLDVNSASVPIGWGGEDGVLQKQGYIKLARASMPFFIESKIYVSEEEYMRLALEGLEECIEKKTFYLYHKIMASKVL